MKNIFYFLVINITTFSLSPNAQWMQTGPPGGRVLSLAANGSTVFAGTDYGVYLSIDNGQSWDLAFIGSIVNALAVNGSTVFAGTTGPSVDYLGVYRSIDNGQNWTQTSLNDQVVQSLAVSGSTIFAGTWDSRVYVSTNNGQNWIYTSFNIPWGIPSLTVNDSTVFAGTYEHGIFRSTDNGQNWTQIPMDNLGIESLAISGPNVFAGTGSGVYLSTDNGLSWTQTTLNNQDVSSLAVSGPNVYAGTTNNGIYFSTDSGQTWSQIALNNQYVSSLAVSGSNVFAGTNCGVYLNWSPTGSNFLIIPALALDGSYVFAGTWDSGLYLSTDNGQIWTQTSLMIQNVNLGIVSIAINDSNAFAVTYCYTCDPIHLGDEYAILFHSTDNGLNWLMTSLDSIYVYSVEVNGSIVFAGTDHGVYLSPDNGQSWTQTTLNNQDVYGLAVNGSNIFAETYNSVYRSADNGQNWTLSLNNQNVRSLTINGSNVFVGTGNGVIRSTDNGQNWTQTSLNNIEVNALTVSGSNVFAGTWDSGVFLSTNNGETWFQINEGLKNQNIWSLAISSEYIFVGTWGTSVWRRPLSEIISSVDELDATLPNNFLLEQNYPNPFNPSTTIRFVIPNEVRNLKDFSSQAPRNDYSLVTLKVYDVLGNEVATLINEEKPAGSYEVEFTSHSDVGQNLSSGIYLYTLQAGNFTQTKKLILMK